MSIEAKFGTKNGGTPMTAEEKLGIYSAEEITDWLIKYHGANESSRSTIEMNIRGAYQTERALGFVEGQSQAHLHMHFSLFGEKK